MSPQGEDLNEIVGVLNARLESRHIEATEQAGQIGDLKRELAEAHARLKAAEDVCVMYSWAPARHITDRDKAAHELWRRWREIVGSDFLKAEAHPDLSDEMVALLAAQRDETRDRTLAKIRSDAPTELPGGEASC